MSDQINFDLKFQVGDKETICGIKQVAETEHETYYLLCATVGDYTREYTLKKNPSDGDCAFHFVEPDVPEELKQHESEISKAIIDHDKAV